MSIQLLACGFVAGLVDAIGGGGGLISVPAFLAAGLPLHLLLGTNKCVSACGTGVTVLRYARAGLLPALSRGRWLSLVVASASCAAVGAAFSQLPAVLERLGVIVPVMIGAVMVFLVKRWFLESREADALVEPAGAVERRLRSRGTIAVVGALGGYDGLFGPGVGTFFLSFMEKLGLRTLNANAVTKVLNLSSNLGALACFALSGKVDWLSGLAVAGSFMAGGYLGSGLVLKRGQALVRVTVLVVTTAMLARYLLTR